MASQGNEGQANVRTANTMHGELTIRQNGGDDNGAQRDGETHS
jgi:hypothetical protein